MMEAKEAVSEIAALVDLAYTVDGERSYIHCLTAVANVLRAYGPIAAPAEAEQLPEPSPNDVELPESLKDPDEMLRRGREVLDRIYGEDRDATEQRTGDVEDQRSQLEKHGLACAHGKDPDDCMHCADIQARDAERHCPLCHGSGAYPTAVHECDYCEGTGVERRVTDG